MRMMRSPALMPAFEAGVPGMGLMTVSAPLRMPDDDAEAAELPRVVSFISV